MLENQELESQNSQLRSKIEAETDKLVAEQQHILKSKLETGQKDLEEINGEVSKTLREHQILLGKFKSTQEELNKVEVRIDLGKKGIQQQESLVKSLKDQEKAIESVVRSLEERQGLLNNQMTPFTEAVNDANKQKIALNEEITDKNSTLDKIQEQIAVAKAEFQDIKNKTAQEELNNDFVRKDLAKRAEMADEREKILKGRELAVQQGEARIAQNANLLNL